MNRQRPAKPQFSLEVRRDDTGLSARNIEFPGVKNLLAEKPQFVMALEAALFADDISV